MSKAFPRIWKHFTIAFLLLFATTQTQAAPPARVDVLISFKQAPGANDLAAVRGQGGRIKYSYNIIPAVAANLPQQALAGLANNPNVALIELDGTVQAVGELENAWGVAKIGADVAHALSITGEGVKVAVIDSGIDYNHPEFLNHYGGGFNFINNDSDPMDDNGHGTHCAGTIGAVANEMGVIGVAPNVTLYAYKVLGANGSGSFSDIIMALQQCVEDQINVTSNSYGSSQNPGFAVESAFINANAAGILNIAAAGNSGNPKGKGNNVIYPAAYSSVVSVAATDSNDNRAYFSSTGPAVELAAPGFQIYSTVPGGYDTYSGTSMACPHVAGVAALLMGKGLDNETTRNLMDLSALDLGATGKDNQFGYGRVDVPMALTLLPGGGGGSGGDGGSGGGTPPGVIDMSVVAIEYSRSGGSSHTKDLNISLTIQETVSGLPVANASVSINLYFGVDNIGSGSGTTNTSGVVNFKLRNAPFGTYSTVVTSVTATGYLWDGVTPDNSDP